MANTKTTTLKDNIKKVIFESFEKTRQNNFIDFNFSFPKNRSAINFLKFKLEIFDSIDEMSQTFLSIHTRAKVVLWELKNQNFEGNHLELLRLILTLPEDLRYGKLKSVSVSFDKKEKTQIDNEVLESIKKDNNNKAKHIKPGITGKKLTKQNKQEDELFEEIINLDFEDSEFELNQNDIKDLEI